MAKLKNFLNIKNESNPILGILLILYILIPINVPKELSSPINSIYGRVIVLLLALTSFTKTNAINGILCLIAAYTLVKRTEDQNNSSEYFTAQKLTPKTISSSSTSELEKLPVSLEEEIISNMIPLANSSSSSKAKYKPILNAVHDAAPADNKYVIQGGEKTSSGMSGPV